MPASSTHCQPVLRAPREPEIGHAIPANSASKECSRHDANRAEDIGTSVSALPPLRITILPLAILLNRVPPLISSRNTRYQRRRKRTCSGRFNLIYRTSPWRSIASVSCANDAERTAIMSLWIRPFGVPRSPHAYTFMRIFISEAFTASAVLRPGSTWGLAGYCDAKNVAHASLGPRRYGSIRLRRIKLGLASSAA